MILVLFTRGELYSGHFIDKHLIMSFVLISLVQLLSRGQLFVTPWTAAHQASLSITNSRSLLKLMSIESVMPSNHLILCDLYAYTVNRIKIWSFP